MSIKNILLVDDLPIALTLIENAAKKAFPHAHCLQTSGVAEAKQAISLTNFDLALVDLGLLDGSGIEVIRCLSEQQPLCIAIVASICDADEQVFQALQAGARGYILKDQHPDWLAHQLQGLIYGQPPLSPAIARKLLQHFQQQNKTPVVPAQELSLREREVLGLLAQGIRIADIGDELGISRHTVGDHVKNIYRKLNISSRAEAALQARSFGLV
jgi:DNA-binding NarL/FixJ family response regulator